MTTFEDEDNAMIKNVMEILAITSLYKVNKLLKGDSYEHKRQN